MSLVNKKSKEALLLTAALFFGISISTRITCYSAIRKFDLNPRHLNKMKFLIAVNC